MTQTLSGPYTSLQNAAIATYGDTVKQQFQGEMILRDTVTVDSGILSDTHNFRAFSKGIAVQHSSSESLTPTGGKHRKVPAQLSNWRAGDYTDLFDEATVGGNINERAVLAQSDIMAIGRALDQLIIGALDAAAGVTGQYAITGNVSVNLGGSNTGMNVAKLLRAKTYLSRQSAKAATHKLVVSAYQVESMLSELQITSADYQTTRALSDNGATLQGSKFFGFDARVLEERAEGGLPFASADVRLCFAYSSLAVGLAEGIAPTSRVDFNADRYSWLSQSVMRAGSAVIDPTGVVAISAYENFT
jgi:hypothetical protein